MDQLHELQGAGKLKQIWLLTKKNFILQKRRPVATALEILVPCLFFLLLVATRAALKASTKEANVYCSQPVSPLDVYRPLLNSPAAGLSNSKRFKCSASPVFVDFNKETQYSKIAYAPNNAQTTALMNNFLRWFDVSASSNNQLKNFTLVGYNTEEDIKDVGEDTVLGVLFYQDNNGQRGDLGISGNKIHYVMRMPDELPSGDGWSTGRNFPQFAGLGPRDSENSYLDTSFVFLQSCLDIAIMQMLKGNTDDIPDVVVRAKPFPFPKWEDDNFIFSIRTIFPLLLVLSYMYTALSIVRNLVLEKEKRLKEAMKMMGLNNWTHWTSWFVKSLSFMLISIIISTIIFAAGGLARHSDNSLIFFFLLLFTISTIFYCFLVSVFFTSSNVASAAGGLIYFLGYFPYFFIAPRFDALTRSQLLSGCLLSPTCIGIGARILAMLESDGTGLTRSSARSPPTDEGNFSMNDVFGMLIFDSVLYMLLAWYIEAVRPGVYGIPRGPLFFLSLKYWFGSRNAEKVSDEMDMVPSTANPDVEPDPEGKQTGIRIINLRKEYNGVGGKKVALNNLSMNMCHGDISVLLGHNGAGKTTSMSIMVGLFPPTSGTAIVNGFDVRTETDKVRRSLGLCPQFDVLWDDLTVDEHLRFFAMLKGMKGQALEDEITNFVQDLDLVPKRHERSSSLSGGQKRALSVAIALVGGSKIVILDEPTSGMDPYKRRQTWDLLLKHKQGRTILLTTHFMDEADLLGDRIAIMSEGRLKCYGSSFFLKQRFGVGYHMTLVKDNVCDVDAVKSLVERVVPNSTLESDAGAELSFLLPREQSSAFPRLFSSIETDRQALGIQSYGVSVTTMEEVFLRVGQGEDASLEERRDRVKEAIKDEIRVGGVEPVYEKLTGWPLRKSQLMAMLGKKYLNSLRHRRSLIAQVLLPVLFAIAAMVVASGSSTSSEPLRSFTLKSYRDNRVLLSNQDIAGDYWTNALNKTQTLLIQEGGSPPTTLDQALLTQSQSFFSSDPRTSNAQAENISGQNTSSVALSRAGSYVSSGFFKNYYVSYSYGGGVISVRRNIVNNKCESYVNGAWTPDFAFTMVQGHVYNFRMIVAPNDTDSILQLSTTSVNPTGNQFPESDFVYVARSVGRSKSIYFSPNATTPVTLFLGCSSAVAATSPITIQATGTDNFQVATAYSWFNDQALHTMAESVNFVDNIILQNFVGDNTARIYAYNYPLPKSVSSLIDNLRTDASGFNIALFMLFGLGFAGASYCVLLVTERVSHAKHLQLVSGVQRSMYWLSYFAWDFVLMLITTVCIIIVFAAFAVPAYSGREGHIALLMILFAWECLPFAYLFSFFFANSSSAYARLSMLMVFFGLGFLILVFVLQIPSLGLEATGKTLKVIFYTLPNYAVSQAFLDMFYNYNYLALCTKSADALAQCRKSGFHYHSDYFSLYDPGVGASCLVMFCMGVFYWVLIALIEFGLLERDWCGRRTVVQRSSRSGSRSGFENFHNKETSVVVKDLTKVYRNNSGVARAVVDGLSFDIPRGECFGLLGVNGAGKSTTFRMLTGEEPMTSGQVLIHGYDLSTQKDEARKYIGYCPQYDGLIPTMTGEELLRMFGMIRGIPSDKLNGVVRDMIAQLDLNKHSHRLCETYSGGNKRKLSTAAAMIGKPDVVFLDEPTTGMDPGARRFIWDALTAFVRDGSSIVITSHSMEECEALCTRLGIMVKGTFMCLGSIQHLKNTFGKGYTLKIKVSRPDATGPIKAFVASSFPDSKFKEEHNGEVTYQIETESRGWVYIFTKLEEAKSRMSITDYSVSQTTLEQVFLGFAAHQNDDNPLEAATAAETVAVSEL